MKLHYNVSQLYHILSVFLLKISHLSPGNSCCSHRHHPNILNVQRFLQPTKTWWITAVSIRQGMLWFRFSDLGQTLRSSLRSDTSNKVRLAMSLTSCWILGEYCLGAPSSGGVAMASEWVAGLVFRSLRAHRAGACRWSCCLGKENRSDKWRLFLTCGSQSSRGMTLCTQTYRSSWEHQKACVQIRPCSTESVLVW